MTPADIALTIAGIVGGVSGVIGAYHAVKTLTRQLSSEKGLRPEFERSCGADVDAAIVAPPGCRVAFYADFFVVRAGSASLTIGYSSVLSARLVGWLGFDAVVLEITHESVSTIKLYLGVDNTRVIKLITARSTRS